MSSYLLEDFVGNGVLKDQIDMLLADGWDDVPTLKMMTPEDMDLLQLTQFHRDALEIRTYLHDRSLMQYADALEKSGKTLHELLETSPETLMSDYHMKRGHVARFIDRASACSIQLPRNLNLPARVTTKVHHGVEEPEPAAPAEVEEKVKKIKEPKSTKPPKLGETKPSSTPVPAEESPRNDVEMLYPGVKLVAGADGKSTTDISGFKSPVVLRPVGGPATVSKGIFSAAPVTPRFCGLVMPGSISEEVTQLPVLEKVMIRKLAPAYVKGNNPFKKSSAPIKLPPPTRASELWADQPTLILCLRRPGCVMCRAEAHQLYARKPIFDAMGIQLVVCLNEHIDAEVRAFWPRYWGGMVVVDENREFFKALGGGTLAKEGLITGFFLNPVSKANWKRATDTGIEYNLTGEGNIKGGLYILRAGNGGVAYQFVERNFGDWAPLEEVLDVCGNIQKS